MPEPLPFVSVIMPVYNEEAFIERSLRAILVQDYPGLKEVICVDGMSDDGTRPLIACIAATDSRVRLVDNSRRIIPAALNIGVREAHCELIARIDGHTYVPPDYLRRCVDLLRQSGADCVGGRWVYGGETYMEHAIGAAMESKFGVGTAQWRGTQIPGDTDTVPFGLWKRGMMLALGGFDETILINEDYEFNYRLRTAGGRIYYSPDIQTVYYPRKSLVALWKQYLQYGLWKARVLKEHPASFQLRHIVAPLFTIGLVAGLLLSLIGPVWRWLYGGTLMVYFTLALFFAARQAARHGWHYFVVLPFVFLILHLAWGLGFLKGVWRWWIRREDKRRVGE